MAVSIDNVYQKVLALANKEQRGYITPQEFNLFADLAQMEIFEQYFYDTNQFKRAVGNNSDYYDMVDLISEKLYLFKEASVVENDFELSSLNDFYRVGEIYHHKRVINYSIDFPLEGFNIVEELDQSDFITAQAGPLTRATSRRPIYWVSKGKIKFIPQVPPLGYYNMRYIRKPISPNWTYVIDPTNQTALYNPSATNHQDFELHPSEEPKLVIKILQLAGVNMKDFNLAQLAGQKEVSVKQQEKQ